jgi:hypothetical protein
MTGRTYADWYARGAREVSGWNKEHGAYPQASVRNVAITVSVKIIVTKILEYNKPYPRHS